MQFFSKKNKMKRLILTITILSIATLSFSQQLSRSVVASGGNYSTNSGLNISSTIGEAMVATLSSGALTLTQGFQQPVSYVKLFFSEYGEGNFNNKYFEIYNPTSDTVDLSAYAYPSVDNGPTTPGVYETWNTFSAGAVILPNDVYIVAHASSDASILSHADEVTYNLSSGNDGYALVYGDEPGSPVNAQTGAYVILDFIGDWDANPGSGWSVAGVSNATVNHTLERKCDQTRGNSNWTESSGTDVFNSEWVVLDNEDWSSLGSFTVCSSVTYGCMDVIALNYDGSALVDDGSCDYGNLGCTDLSACNYDSTANTNDGSCIFPVAQPVAINCWESYQLNTTTCSWELVGSQDLAPLTACWETATFDSTTCAWVVTGSQDSAPALACWETTAFDTITCSWVISGTQDSVPAITCWETATFDSTTCAWVVTGSQSTPAPTGLFATNIIHNRVTINWDNMNYNTCFVDFYRAQYREVGTSTWTQKNMVGNPDNCTNGLGNQRTYKDIRYLTANTTYEYQMKVWYCGGGNSGWSDMETFTTVDNCPNVANLTVYGSSPTKATFNWMGTNGVYSFVRLKARVDSISNPTGADFFQIGGSGVSYGTFTKNKNGLTPGETYRGQARTYCDPNGGQYRSLSWSPLVFWTQPTVRIEGGEAIANLDVYPNPSRDVFNVMFTSEEVQDLKVRVINLVGKVVYTEDLQQFVGEYTKSIDLATYNKGIYLLEIETDNGVINKKLILQ
jgi:hypothetical protein